MLPACPVDHRHGAAGEVDEQPLARRDGPGAASASAGPPTPDTGRRTRNSRTRPAPRPGTPPTAAQASHWDGAARDAPRPIGHRPLIRRNVRRRRKQQRFELLVIEPVRQWPAQPAAPRPAHVAVHRAWLRRKARPTTRCGRPGPRRSRKTSRILRIDTLSPGIPVPCCSAGDKATLVEDCQPYRPVHHRTPALIAITGTSDRHQTDQVIAIKRIQ